MTSKRPSNARDAFPPLLTQEELDAQRYPGKRRAERHRTDWQAMLATKADKEAADSAFKRFVRDRLTWYAIAAVALAVFIYFAV